MDMVTSRAFGREAMDGDDGARALKEQVVQELREVAKALAARRAADGDSLRRRLTEPSKLHGLPRSHKRRRGIRYLVARSPSIIPLACRWPSDLLVTHIHRYLLDEAMLALHTTTPANDNLFINFSRAVQLVYIPR